MSERLNIHARMGSVLCDVAHKCLAKGSGAVRLKGGGLITATQREEFRENVVLGMYNGRPGDILHLQPFDGVDAAFSYLDKLPPDKRPEYIKMVRVFNGGGSPGSVEYNGKLVTVI